MNETPKPLYLNKLVDASGSVDFDIANDGDLDVEAVVNSTTLNTSENVNVHMKYPIYKNNSIYNGYSVEISQIDLSNDDSLLTVTSEVTRAIDVIATNDGGAVVYTADGIVATDGTFIPTQLADEDVIDLDNSSGATNVLPQDVTPNPDFLVTGETTTLYTTSYDAVLGKLTLIETTIVKYSEAIRDITAGITTYTQSDEVTPIVISGGESAIYTFGASVVFDDKLSNITSLDNASLYKWIQVDVKKDGEVAESYIANNTRETMGNGLSYWFGRVNRSELISLTYSEVNEDDVFDNLYALVSVAPTTITIPTAFNDDLVAPTNDSELQEVPVVSRKQFPHRRVFVPEVISPADTDIITSIEAVLELNNGLVSVTCAMGSGLDVSSYISGSTIDSSVIVPSFPSFASRVRVYVQKMRLFDPFTSKNYYIPSSTQAILTMGALKETPWLAPAGQARGGVNALKVYPEFDDAEIGVLYNVGRLNCIDNTARGYFLWGQRTAQKFASALDRIHAVDTMIDMEITLEQGLKAFIFEIASQNNIAKIEAFLEGVRAYYLDAQAVTFFEYELDTSMLQYNQLNVKITTKPTDVIEFISVGVNITREGVSVTEEV